MTTPLPLKIRYLWMAVRPRTLLAGIAPVMLGNALGVRDLRNLGADEIMIAAASLIGVVALQAAANLVNDVADASRGVDNAGRCGPTRMTQSGLLAAADLRRTYRLLFVVAIVAASFLACYGGLLVIGLALIGALAAYLYTGGPWPLSHLAMGELLAWFFFGPLAVAGCCYLHTHVWEGAALLLGSGSGLWAASLMAINNYRDRVSDGLVGKTTLAQLLPEPVARSLPVICQGASLFILLPYGISMHHTFMTALAVLALTLFSTKYVLPLLSGSAAAQNTALRDTMLGNFAYAVVLCALI